MGWYSKSPAERFTVHPTMKCNLKCPDCLNRKLSRETDMPLELVRKIASAVGEHNHIFISGGEPTLHPQFRQIIEIFVRRKPEFVRIVTNGYTFTGSEAKTKDFMGWLANLHKQTGTRIELQVSADDQHLMRAKGRSREQQEEDLRKRAQRILKNIPKGEGVNLTFIAGLRSGQSKRKTLKKYGLPPKITATQPWQSELRPATELALTVLPNGTVYRNEFEMNHGRPIANLRWMPMRKVLISFPKPPEIRRKKAASARKKTTAAASRRRR